MLKITETAKGGQRVLRLEGKLMGPWAEELLQAYKTQAEESPVGALDLSGVTFVDERGLRALHDLSDRGVPLQALSGFVAELLRRRNGS
jgi:anti-anti-sigma regulatory factor